MTSVPLTLSQTDLRRQKPEIMASKPNRTTFITKLISWFHLPTSNWFGALVWVLGLTVLTAVLIYGSLLLWKDYSENNVATQVEVIKSAPVRPRLSACIPYRAGTLLTVAEWLLTNVSDCMDCEALANHSWDVWNEPNFTFDPARGPGFLQDLLASAIMKKLLDTDDNFSALLLDRTNFNWNQPIVEALLRFFACTAAKDDRFMANGIVDWVENCRGFQFHDLRRISDATMNRLFDHLLDGLEVYLKTEVTFSGGSENSTLSALRRRPMAILSDGSFCFPLLSNSTAENFTYTAFPDQTPPPWRRTKRINEFWIWPDLDGIFGLSPIIDHVYHTDTMTMAQITSEKVDIAFAMDAKVREQRSDIDCDRDDSTSPGICIATRNVQDIVRFCGCLPFSFRHLQPNETSLPYCNDDTYAACGSTLIDIEHECTNKCDYTFYRWKPSVLAESTISPHQTFAVTFAPARNAPYLEFAITIRDTPEKFLAAIGGLINLYLGFSGVSVCAFIIFCIEQLIEKLKASKKSEIPGNESTVPWTGNSYLGEAKIRDVIREEFREVVDKLEQKMQGMDLRIQRIENALGNRF